MMILLQKSNDYNVTNYDDNDITKVTPDKYIMNIMLQKSRVAELGSLSWGAKMATPPYGLASSVVFTR